MRITVHSLRYATKHQWFRVVSFRKFVGRVRRVVRAHRFVPVARSTVALVMCTKRPLTRKLVVKNTHTHVSNEPWYVPVPRFWNISNIVD